MIETAIETYAKKWRFVRIVAFVMLSLVALFVVSAFLFPVKMPKVPYSAVLKDKDGILLSARIAADGQWRFQPPDSLPAFYKEALLRFEDKRFYQHPGVDPIAVVRAAVQNFRSGTRRSGGSTISMQLIRLSRKGKARNPREKIIEAIEAIRLEIRYSKEEILRMYAAYAPYGGNVVGIEAAAWRWFGCAPHELSKAEMACLAVLPNAPSLLTLQRNRDQLLAKRDHLLMRLSKKNLLDSLSCMLALQEPLPEAPLPLPDIAPHYLEYMRRNSGDQTYQSDLDYTLQLQSQKSMLLHHAQLKASYIHNMGLIVRETASGKIRVWHGNLPCYTGVPDCHNDMVVSYRSSGSILKPFLYAGALHDGIINSSALLPDVPSWIGGFSPRNFDENYQGAISAHEALRRSLNIPFVHLLRKYGVERFHKMLQQIGFEGFNKSSSHYGLSMILGGGEVSLFELTEAYGKMARVLDATHQNSEQQIIESGAAWLTAEVLKTLNRPETESGWTYSGRTLKMAWKTGTSYGLRDAWAVGFNPRYIVGVWAGNSDGTGRPGLTGVRAAAPLLFDIALQLGMGNEWFDMPSDRLVQEKVCRESGYASGPNCSETKTILRSNRSKSIEVCSFHQLIRTDTSGRYRLPADCESPLMADTRKWFILPPLMEHFYKMHHVNFKPLPSYFPGCSEPWQPIMDFIYPPPNAVIFQPRDYSGKLNPLVFELSHRQPEALVFWHLNEQYAGSSRGPFHQLRIFTKAGKHTITVVDENGASIQRSFELRNSPSSSD